MAPSRRFVSIIIPCEKIDPYASKCVDFCQKLDYEDFEIILLPDVASDKIDGISVISTGRVPPGKKRNVGIANAAGDFCAFIDSDAYPRVDWLKNTMKYFDDPQIAGVGGPGVTPDDEGDLQKASGYILSSFMVGNLSSRYKSRQNFESDDVHSCNFVARKTVLKEAGGWNEKYWPGEDTLISLEIKKLSKKLVEASDVVVYHHRRPLLMPHLRQISRFGVHRGFFVRKFGGNSFKLNYFVPSLLVVSLSTGILVSLVYSFFLNISLIAITAYLTMSLIGALREVKETKLVIPVWFGIIATHFVYGLSFLAGFLRRDLQS